MKEMEEMEDMEEMEERRLTEEMLEDTEESKRVR